MMGPAKRFKAPWSTSLRLITTFTVALFLLTPLILLIGGGRQVWLLASLILVISTGFLNWAFRTQFIRYYVLSAGHLIVERFGTNTEFDLGRLESIEEDPAAMRGIYTMTNGGLFSFGGKKCKNRKLGVFEAYATDKKKSVVLRFPSHVLVVTPEDPAAFVQAVQALSAA